MDPSIPILTVLSGVASWIAVRITKWLRQYAWAEDLVAPIVWAVCLAMSTAGWKFVAPIDPMFPQTIGGWLMWAGSAAITAMSGVALARKASGNEEIGRPEEVKP